MKLTTFGALDSATKFIVLDVETMNDTRLYHRYFTRDPRPAPLRWPFRRIVAASVMAITVDNGVWEVDAFQSFAGENDRIVVINLFKWMAERPDYNRVVTYGGASEDLNLFKIAAMEFGLQLPWQLRHGERDRSGWVHLDLALALKAGSGTFVHQSELAARLSLPSKLSGSAGQVPYLIEAGRVQDCAAICEVDVLLTSLLLAGHLVSLGEVKSLNIAQYCTMRFVRNQRPFARYHRELGNYLASSERNMLEEQNRWLEAS